MKEMTIGELAEKLSRLSEGHQEMTLSEFLKMAIEETTVDALLNKMESFAGDYYFFGAIESIERNKQMYELTDEELKINEVSKRRIVKAVLVDFINFVAARYGGDRGERVEHLAKAFFKNEMARVERRKDKSK